MGQSPFAVIRGVILEGQWDKSRSFPLLFLENFFDLGNSRIKCIGFWDEGLCPQP